MEQSPTVTRLFHIRYLSLTAILLAIDATWLYSSVDQIWTNGPSMIMLFALEVRPSTEWLHGCSH